jgi:hypothetical protein
VVAAAVYLVLSIAGDLLGSWIERRLRARGFAAPQGSAVRQGNAAKGAEA